MSANFQPPLWWVPASVVIDSDRLWAPASDRAVRFPPPGSWRSLVTETDLADPQHIAAVARRFGPLTAEAMTDAGKSLETWRRLGFVLHPLAAAWTETGEPATPAAISTARHAARELQERVLMFHRANGGTFSAHAGGEWRLDCLTMLAWWQMSAIYAVFAGDPLRRCRYCATWFSLTGLRSDAGFCSPAHRSAFYQKRQPAVGLWAEAF